MTLSNLTSARALVADAGLDVSAVELIINEALAEDLGGRGVLPQGTGAGLDVTSHATIPSDARATGTLVAREPGTVAGIPVAALTLALVLTPAGAFDLDVLIEDGAEVQRDDILITVEGSTRALLTAERVALNLITMMSGVATTTHRWAAALEGSGTRIRDTRKTTPGLRVLQKYAVRAGGGTNHRLSLADAALIKDNHVIAAGGVVEAFTAVRAAYPDLPVQVEVTTSGQAHAVVEAGATDVLLDNMSPDEMATIVHSLKGRAQFEASGGLSLNDARDVAATGVDFVAVGEVTHSAPILDIALDLLS